MYNNLGDLMKKIILGFLLLFCLVPLNVFSESDTVAFSKCVDGDTAKFIINGKEYSTRFLAIDTPETKHPKKGVEPFGKEASSYTCNALKKASSIVLEYDKNSTKEDKYGRRLAWIFVDGELLQEKLIRKGYAKVAYLYGDYQYTEKLKKVEKKAKEEKLGVWQDTNQKEEDTSADDLTINLDKILKKVIQYIGKQLKSML